MRKCIKEAKTQIFNPSLTYGEREIRDYNTETGHMETNLAKEWANSLAQRPMNSTCV